MDYIPLLEVAATVLAGFILAGTFVGLCKGEVHFPIQWLNEAGYERDDPKFKRVVIANVATASILVVVAAAHLIALS